MIELRAHLTFRGECEAAFAFYAQCLGGEITLMLKYGDSPAATDVPPGWREKIVHATMTIGDTTLSGADVPPDHYRPPQGFYLLLNTDEAERIFNELADGGSVRMPLQKTFWSPAFGVVVDRFGVPWEVSSHQAI